MKCNHLMQREILSLMQNTSGKNGSKIVSLILKNIMHKMVEMTLKFRTMPGSIN
jgi:hypothetical protein